MHDAAHADTPGLMVIWSSRDREVALNTAFMYAKNSLVKGWWDQVRLVVWGPSVRLADTDHEIQQELKAMRDAGVQVQACRACADRYGLADRLTELGCEVIYMGQPLTAALKHGWSVLTF